MTGDFLIKVRNNFRIGNIDVLLWKLNKLGHTRNDYPDEILQEHYVRFSDDIDERSTVFKSG